MSFRSLIQVRSFALATLATACLCGASANAASPSEKLMGIAASCTAFYLTAFDKLDVPLEGNEAKRQFYYDAAEAIGRTKLSMKDEAIETYFKEHVIGRTVILDVAIEQNPDVAGPKIKQNLKACDGFMERLSAESGLPLPQ